MSRHVLIRVLLGALVFVISLGPAGAETIELGPYDRLEETLDHTWYPQDALDVEPLNLPFQSRFIQFGRQFEVTTNGLGVAETSHMFRFNTWDRRVMHSGGADQNVASFAMVFDEDQCGVAVSFGTMSERVVPPPSGKFALGAEVYARSGDLLQQFDITLAPQVQDPRYQGASFIVVPASPRIAGLRLTRADSWAMVLIAVTVDPDCGTTLTSSLAQTPISGAT